MDTDVLFYISFPVLAAAGFIAGYKTGFVKTGTGLMLITAAFACSCYFFLPLADTISGWPDDDIVTTRIISFSVLFVLTVTLFFLTAKMLPAFFYSNKKKAGKITGGILGVLITAALFTVTSTLNGIPEMPAEVATRLDETGVNALVDSGAAGLRDLFIAAPAKNGTKILSANNTSEEPAKSFSTGFIPGNYVIRPGLEKQMLELINRERNKLGLRALVYDSGLAIVARKHSADMLARGYFSHNSPEGITPFERMHAAGIRYHFAGENLAFSAAVLKAHEGLMLSPGHRANILNRQYGKAGIAVLENSAHELMIAQEFTD